MNQKEYEMLAQNEQVDVIEPQTPPAQDQQPKEDPTQTFDLSNLLGQLRVVKKSISTVPTFTPRNYLEQFQLYKNGTTYRLYVYVAGSWRYTTLT